MRVGYKALFDSLIERRGFNDSTKSYTIKSTTK